LQVTPSLNCRYLPASIGRRFGMKMPKRPVKSKIFISYSPTGSP
jgi:hypothetical protein